MLARPRNPKTRRPGAVLPWVVVALAAIFGIVALTMDGGRLMDERRRAQAAADAAALAAADSLYDRYSSEHGLDPSGAAAKAARASAKTNGYANDKVNSIVTVNVPPTTGEFT